MLASAQPAWSTSRTRAAVLAGIALTLSACGPQPMRAPPPRDAVPGEIRSEPCTYTDVGVRYAADCGYLFTPERRDVQHARLIAIPYLRIRAATDAPDVPIFVLNGGPGASNMQIRRMAAWFASERDIVLVGYRGVDGAVRLDCPEVDAAVMRAREWFTAPALDAWRAAYRACAGRLAAKQVDVTGYTMLDVVEDVEDVRRALRYERIHLLSRSYGTRLALIYGLRYPERVGRSAMISVNPPGHFRFDPSLLDAQLSRYAELCTADATCARRGDPRNAIALAWRNMPERWLVFPINRDAALLGSFLMLYNTDSAGGVLEAWQAAARGDYSGIALIAAATPVLLNSGFAWGEAGTKALSADFTEVMDASTLAELRPGEHTLGAPGNVLGWSAAGGWPRRLIPEQYRTPQHSDIETLFLGGSLDVSTPPETARDDLLPVMPRARQVTLRDFAHAGDLLNAQPHAARRLLRTYFATGAIDAGGYEPRVINMNPGWMSWPVLAKAILGGVTALLALLAFAFFHASRRWWPRRKRRVS